MEGPGVCQIKSVFYQAILQGSPGNVGGCKVLNFRKSRSCRESRSLNPQAVARNTHRAAQGKLVFQKYSQAREKWGLTLRKVHTHKVM